MLVRLPFDELFDDAVGDIWDRVSEPGLPLPELPIAPGVARGAAAPEGAARDRAALLAAAIDAAAAAADRTIWFLLDNPSVNVSEDLRLTLGGFVDAALVQPRLRLVITGFETKPLPGQEFQAPSEAEVVGSPGLVVEYVGGFRRDDVLDLLTLAAQDLTGRPQDRQVIEAIADRVLLGLQSFKRGVPGRGASGGGDGLAAGPRHDGDEGRPMTISASEGRGVQIRAMRRFAALSGPFDPRACLGGA